MGSGNNITSFHAFVQGRVQGVGFRMFTRDVASEMGCSGWVRNLPDGRVEVYAESDETTLTEFLTKLSQGPPWAHVADIDITWEKPAEPKTGFKILR